MATENILPDGANWLTPYITVSNAEASLEFYQKAFGFETGMTMPGPDGSPAHAEMKHQGNAIMMFAPEGAWGSTDKTPVNLKVDSPTSFYVYCADVDALAAQAKTAGAEILNEPEDMFWGDRTVMLRDPDGYKWMFATKVGEFDPSKMPQM